MNKVFRHRAESRDQYLGHVDQAGIIFETRLGPDTEVGRVDLETGRIYETRTGATICVGYVDLENHKVYRLMADEQELVGKVEPDGALILHKPLAPDEYVGRVAEMYSVVHAAGGFLLLVLPVLGDHT